MTHTIQIQDLSELTATAQKFLQLCDGERVFAFRGEMGVGKTTLIQEICEQLQVIDKPSSPTYAIANEYRTADGYIVYHLDLYRLKSIDEAYAIGIEEYLYSGHHCFIEWPELIAPLLEDMAVDVHMTLNDDETRLITIKPRYGKETNNY